MEVLTAVVIISVGIMSVVSIFPVAFSQADRAIEYGVADTLTENVKCMLKAQCLYMANFSTCPEMNNQLYPWTYTDPATYNFPPINNATPGTVPWHFPWFAPWSRKSGAAAGTYMGPNQVPMCNPLASGNFRYSSILDKSDNCLLLQATIASIAIGPPNLAYGLSIDSGSGPLDTFKIPISFADVSTTPPTAADLYKICYYNNPPLGVMPFNTQDGNKSRYSWSVVFQPAVNDFPAVDENPTVAGCRYRVQIAIWKDFDIEKEQAGGVLAYGSQAQFGLLVKPNVGDDTTWFKDRLVVNGVVAQRVKVGDYIAQMYFNNPAVPQWYGNGIWYRIRAVTPNSVFVDRPFDFLSDAPAATDPFPPPYPADYVIVSREKLIRLTDIEVTDIDDL